MAGLISYEQRTPMPDDVICVFDAVPKCAGQSLLKMLFDVYPRVLNLLFAGDYFTLLDHHDTRYDLVTNHSTWGVHHFLPDTASVAYATMLRDPLRTAVSFYRYARKTFLLDADIDLDTFLLGYAPDMFLTRFGGSPETARRRLFGEYRAFGFVEDYDASIAHIGRELGIAENRITAYRVNVSEGPGQNVRPDTARYFRERNQRDYAFFHEAREVFKRRTSGSIRPAAADCAPQASATKKHKAEGSSGIRQAPGQGDLHRSLDVGDLHRALTLFSDKSVDSLADHELCYLAGLYAKVGDRDRAASVFDTLTRRFPHHYTMEHVDFLLETGDPDRAVRLLEDEIALYDRFGDIPPDSMLFSFSVDCLCKAVRAKYKKEARLDPDLTRRVASRFEVSAVALHKFLQGLFNLGLYEQLAEIHADHAGRHAESTLHPAIEKLAAMALYQRGLLSEARQAFEAVLDKAPLDGEALAARHVVDRRTGNPLASLDQTLKAARRYSGTLFAASLAKEVAVSLYEAGRKEEAFDLLGSQSHPSRERLLQAFLRENPGVPFEEADLSDCLVIKAGPPMVFDFLRGELLCARAERFDLIGSFDPASGPPLPVGKAVAFPGTRYIHDAHFEALSGQLPQKRYQTCLVVMSNLDTGYYREILALARALCDRDVLLYSFDNLGSARYKTTLPRQRLTRPASPAERRGHP